MAQISQPQFNAILTGELHIGRKIREEVLRQNLSISEFADLINTARTNIYNIYDRASIDCKLLEKISVALGVNFFTILADDFDKSNANK